MDFDPYLFIRKLPPLSSVVTPVRHTLLPRQVRSRASLPSTLNPKAARSLLPAVMAQP